MLSITHQILGIFDPIDKQIQKNKFQGSFYIIKEGQRHIIMKECTINFIKLRANAEYYVEFISSSTESGERSEGVPIYQSMDLLTFEQQQKSGEKYGHFQWIITEQMQKRIGCCVLYKDKKMFKYLFCKLIRSKSINKSIFGSIEYCKELPELPTYYTYLTNNNSQLMPKFQFRIGKVPKQPYQARKGIEQILKNGRSSKKNMKTNISIFVQVSRNPVQLEQ